jgi:ankyrin repeat protein
MRGKPILLSRITGYASVWSGYKEMTMLLVKYGADINTPDADGRTSVHYCARRGHTDLLRYLLAQGADKSAKNLAQLTPLVIYFSPHFLIFYKHFAAKYNQVECAKILIEAGEDVDITSNQNLTPLHLACSQGNYDAAKFLIESKANVDVTQNLSVRYL